MPVQPLKDLAAALLTAGGFTADEAGMIADSLVLSELMGHGSHGLLRVRQYLHYLKIGDVVSGAQLNILHETPISLLADAHKGAGQVIMPALLNKLHDKIKTQATVTAAVRNCGHIGRLGEWLESSAKAGYPGLLMVNDNGASFLVAPPGGRQPVTSTNPIAFGIPLPDGEVFITDMSTSAIAFGKVRLAKLIGQVLPPDCIQDAEGKMTTDPSVLLSNPMMGSMLPMGGAQGYKGFALSMFVDMLGAGLSGGQAPPAVGVGKQLLNNLTLTLWNPEFFAGLPHMQHEAQKYINFIRAAAPIDPAKPIRLPGDRMTAIRQAREQTGIPLSPELVQDLRKLADELNILWPAALGPSI